MVCQTGCNPWRTTSRQQLPDLSQPQATVWARGSFGMGLARSCALTAVRHLLAQGLRRTEQTGRRRPRALPRGWTVRVLAARGLEAPWLLRRLTRRGGHPCVRLNPGGSVRPTGAPWWRPLPTVAPRPGTRGRGTGLALTRHQVAGTWLARWAEGDKAPGLLLTALPPAASDAGWEGRRAWMAPGVKSTKRAGWQWHRTRLPDPARAARRW